MLIEITNKFKIVLIKYYKFVNAIWQITMRVKTIITVMQKGMQILFHQTAFINLYAISKYFYLSVKKSFICLTKFLNNANKSCQWKYIRKCH